VLDFQNNLGSKGKKSKKRLVKKKKKGSSKSPKKKLKTRSAVKRDLREAMMRAFEKELMLKKKS